MSKPFVIAIAGVSGAGKSTLCRNLAETIDDASIFGLDYYEEVEGAFPENWRAYNFDINMVNLPQVTEALIDLINGKTVEYPFGQGRVEPAATIIFEQQFGRVQPEMQPLIDILIFVELPYEIALSRRILRMLNHAESPLAAVERLQFWIPLYLDHIRDMYLAIDKQVRASADFTLDGNQSEEDMLKQTLAYIEQFKANKMKLV